MLVITDGAGRDSVMVQQLLRVAGVFASDQINFFQNTQRAQSDVFQISDRRSYNVESVASVFAAFLSDSMFKVSRIRDQSGG